MKTILSRIQVAARLKKEQDYLDFLNEQYDKTVDGKKDLIADINSDRDHEARSRKAVFYTLGIVSLLSTLRAAIGSSIKNSDFDLLSSYAEVSLGAISILISFAANSVANETKTSQEALQATRDYAEKIRFFEPVVTALKEQQEEVSKQQVNVPGISISLGH